MATDEPKIAPTSSLDNWERWLNTRIAQALHLTPAQLGSPQDASRAVAESQARTYQQQCERLRWDVLYSLAMALKDGATDGD